MKVGEVSDLPDGVPEHLRASGISELYPPQAAAVEAGVTEGESLVASVPTASGKTLIATLAMLSAIERGGKALYIVPLRALAGEKRDEFARFEEQGISVGMSIGDYESTDDWLGSSDIVVATSEKVDSLVRNGADWIDDLTCVVADEVHLVDDAGRGPTLEVTLAKLRRRAPDLQVVALSATVGNAGEIAEWLDARLVDSEWRPIELRKGVYYGDAINFDDGSQYELPRNGKATETVVRDTLADEGSTLVFVNSRRNAESAARRLADVVEPMLGADERRRLAEVAEEIRDVSDTETSRDLAAAVEKGAAFHHAGLASQHRSLVEDAFRARRVKVVSATPTLAAGVNTPSRRVVVRDWRRYDASAGGMAPLSTLEVHQMFGRAGRPGLDPYGEAVLLASNHDEMEELFDRYIWSDPEPVRSKLAAEPALRTHVLSTVATGFATTRSGLLSFLDETLYATQTPERGRIETVTDNVIDYLEANDFVERAGDDLQATSLGHTVSRLYLDPMSAAEIIDGLRAADEAARAAAADVAADVAPEAAEREAAETGGEGPEGGEVGPAAGEDRGPEGGEAGLSPGPTALGLYHLVSRTPDMYQLYLRSGDRETYTEIAYEREAELPGLAPSEFDPDWDDWLSALKTAKLLEDWADEVDEDRITTRYGVGPGDVRGKVDVAQWLLSAAERLAAELDVECVPAVREARMRVEHGVREELLDLVGVRGVGRKRARRLHRAGIETPAELREAPKGVVLRALSGRRKTAENVLRNAGREDPAMDDVEPAGAEAVPDAVVEAEEAAASSGDGSSAAREASGGPDEEQADLGDFG